MIGSALEPAPALAPAAPAAGGQGAAAGPRSAAGPLLAVCGLTGGAGASTLSYLVALERAAHSSSPVLVCDAGGPGAGLALYAGACSPRSLEEAGERLEAGRPLCGGLFAEPAPGVRLIATGPALAPEGSPAGLRGLLTDAREAHALTVIDCGTLARLSARVALELATHVAWVLPATLGALSRAGAVLASLEAGQPSGSEIVVARREQGERKAGLRELSRLAEERQAPLVLMPHIPDLAEEGHTSVLEAAELTLAGIATLIRS